MSQWTHRACEIAASLDIETRRVYHVRQKLRKRFNAETNEHLISVAAAEGFIYPRSDSDASKSAKYSIR